MLGAEVPAVDRPPSQLIRERFWVSTQPMEEPEHPAQFHELLDQLQMTDRIMFSTDYPHWDFDAPNQALPARLTADQQRKILHENAAALYGLPTPADAAATGD
jgi:predicted TIM-barrel fold metal-dependent hydrolase